MTDRGHDASHGGSASLVGRQLGNYHVVALLGVGGMGEVYRARDAKLERDVAIKVVTPFFADDRERLSRFEREARLLAALNHPHVGAIYGFEESDSVRFLVLELVEGETLADRIARAAPAMPLDEALSIAQQLTDGLDAAHEKGIIHRDLKPGNIKITPDGIVKILDFGLARIDSPDKSDSNLSHSPTITLHGTRAGVILGTAAYMSPEQTRGRPLDKRTDIWAFGCVLYEMLTGRAAFGGETVSDTIAVILGREPDWAALPASTPSGVRRLLERCLDKDLKRRLRDIGDARIDLDAKLRHPASPIETNRATWARSVRRLRVAVGLLAALLTASVAALIALRPGQTPPPDPVRRFSMELGYVRPVISPDGQHIAYRSNGGLWIRDIDSETPREIPGAKAPGGYYSDTGYYLVWSPDSQEIAFLADNELRRVSVRQGGAPTTICALPPGRTMGRQIAGLAWSRDGQTIVFSRYGAGIYEVPVRAGAPKLLWPEDHADDVLLFDTPQGRAVVFAAPSAGHVLVVRTPAGERRELAQLASSWPELVYSPSGHILYRQDPVESPSIWAVPFSETTLTAPGNPFLVERAGQGMSLSSEGTLAYLDTGRIRAQRLAWRDRAGTVLEQSSHTHNSIDLLSASPDRKRAVVMANDGANMGYWLYDLPHLSRRRVELGRESDSARLMLAFFSRSGDEIFYTVAPSTNETRVFARSVDGLSEARPVAAPPGFKVAQALTADGRYLILAAAPNGAGNVGLWLWDRDGDGGKGKAVPFSQNTQNELVAALSPDGRYLAYTSTISGRVEVWVRPFPDGKDRWQVSMNGGGAPVWRPDGQELYFAEGDALMRVPVSTAAGFSAGPAEVLFEHPTLRISGVPAARYVVSADGQRFLTVETERERTVPAVRYVQNWRLEFRGAAPSPAP